MLMIYEEPSCLFIEQTVSYNGSYVPKIYILNSEFSDSVLFFDFFNSAHTNALLISVTLCSCFRHIDKRMCVTLTVVLTVPSTYVELPIFCISEWPRGFNFVISLSFLVSFGEVKETVTKKWCKTLQH